MTRAVPRLGTDTSVAGYNARQPLFLRRYDVRQRLFLRGYDVREPLLLRRYDEITILTLFLGLAFLLPARLVIPALGAAGRPAVLFSLGLGLLWLLAQLRHDGVPHGPQPVRWLVSVYLLVQLVTYVVGFDRGLTGAESRSADRWMIVSFAMVGLALFVTDGIRSREVLDTLLRRFTWGAGATAFVGALQFLAGVDLTRYIRIPGLAPNSELIGIGARGDGFARVAGTMSHYIEFGVVLAAALPLAIHYAFFSTTRAQRVRRWLLVAVIASAVPFSVSRSGVLAAAVAMAVLFCVWPWRLRFNAVVGGVVAVAVYHAAQPGLLGTIKSLFTRAGDDPSVQSRTEATTAAQVLIDQRPWLGRGAGTFIPEQYFLLDNQIVNTLVSSGLIGLAALIAIFIGGYAMARSTRLRAEDQQTRHLGQALAASLLVGLACSTTFDSLSFTGFTCVFFLLLGAIGALWRLDPVALRRPLQAAAPGDRYVASPWMAPRTEQAR